MMSSMVRRLTDYFVINEIIKDEDRDIYYYGLRQGFLILINSMTIIVIGLLSNMLWQTTLFLCTYIPLRIYGGGYHAKTEARCYLVSLIMIIVVLLAIKLIPLNVFVVLSFLGLGSLFIWILAPIEDANKPLDGMEKKVYKNRIRIILALKIVITLLAILLNLNAIALVISTSVLTMSFMLFAARIVNHS